MSRVNYNPQIFLTIFYYTLQFSKSIYPKVVLRMHEQRDQRSSLARQIMKDAIKFMTRAHSHIRSIDIFHVVENILTTRYMYNISII